MSAALWLVPLLVALSAYAASGAYDRTRPGVAGVLLACAALAAVLASFRSGARGRGWWRPCVAAVACVAATAPLLLELGLRFDRIDVLVPVVDALLTAFGISLPSAEGALYAGGYDIAAVTVDAAKLGLLPMLWFLAAAAGALVASDAARPLRTWTVAAAVTAVFGVVLYLCRVALAVQHAGPVTDGGELVVGTFVGAASQVVGWLPLTLFLARFAPWRAGRDFLAGSHAAPRSVAAPLAAATALGLAVAWLWNHEPSGEPSRGRIVVDEGHSREWSSALTPLDRDTHGRNSVYTYTQFVRFLDQYFDVRVDVDAEYTDESLADVDVLVLKTPTLAFTTSEIDAVEAFVRRGGGLLALGDHTDLLGSTSNFAPLTERFGLAFRRDASNRLHDGMTHEWTPIPWLTHPAIAGVTRLALLTSCAMDAAGATPLLVARDAFAEPLDYSAHSFFGDVTPDLDDRLGVHVLAAAKRVGAGRVVCFGDSTIFSTFCLMQGETSEFLLRTVAWLSQRGPRRDATDAVAAGIALAALLALVAAVRSAPRSALAVLLPAGWTLGIVAGVAAVRAVDAAAHPLPEPIRPLPRIAFVRDGCDYELPSPILESGVPDDRAFDALFVATQRAGLAPSNVDLPAAFAWERIVLVRPSAELVRTHGKRLHQHVHSGGAVLVLADDAAVLASIEELVGVSASGKAIELEGGSVPATGAASVFEVGTGLLVVVSEPSRFSRAVLGSQFDDLAADDARRGAFDELFATLDALEGRESASIPGGP